VAVVGWDQVISISGETKSYNGLGVDGGVVGFPGADIEGKPRVFLPYLGGLPKYMARCNEAAAQGDEGFVLS
jgi:hypothetical protein